MEEIDERAARHFYRKQHCLLNCRRLEVRVCFPLMRSQRFRPFWVRVFRVDFPGWGEERKAMKASKFTDAQKAFIIKQGEDSMSVKEICRRAGTRLVWLPSPYFQFSAITGWSCVWSAAESSNSPNAGGVSDAIAFTIFWTFAATNASASDTSKSSRLPDQEPDGCDGPALSRPRLQQDRHLQAAAQQGLFWRSGSQGDGLSRRPRGDH